VVLGRIMSFGMLRRVALVRTEVSEEPSASFMGMARIGEFGTPLAVTSTNARCLLSINEELLESKVTASV
jgi:hypothetical protein